MIRAAALGMTADDLAVGVLSLAGVRPAAVQGAVEVLLVECSPPELDFFARQLEAHLPVRVDQVLLGELAAAVRRQKRAGRWRAAVTSFCHLPEVERLLSGRGVPVIALLAEAHLETLHRLAQLPAGTRVGVASAAVETAHNLEHSIANAGLPNIALVGACPAEGAALGRLLRRVDVIVCSSRGGRAGPGARGPRRAGDRSTTGPSTRGRSKCSRPSWCDKTVTGRRAERPPPGTRLLPRPSNERKGAQDAVRARVRGT